MVSSTQHVAIAGLEQGLYLVEFTASYWFSKFRFVCFAVVIQTCNDFSTAASGRCPVPFNCFEYFLFRFSHLLCCRLLVRKTIKSDFFDLIGVERAVDLQQPSPLYSSSFSYTFPVASTSRPGGSAVLPPKGMSRTASSPAPSTALNFTEFGQQSRSQPFGAASNSPFLMSSRRTAVTGNMSQASAALAALRALPDTPVHSFGLPTASLTSNQLLRASSPMAVLQRHVFDSPATPNVRKQ
jgi:hypothetical protein